MRTGESDCKANIDNSWKLCCVADIKCYQYEHASVDERTREHLTFLVILAKFSRSIFCQDYGLLKKVGWRRKYNLFIFKAPVSSQNQHCKRMYVMSKEILLFELHVWNKALNAGMSSCLYGVVKGNETALPCPQYSVEPSEIKSIMKYSYRTLAQQLKRF